MAISLAVGTRLPAHATSMGQALLADLHPRELERFFAGVTLKSFTPFTLTTEGALRDRLAEVRRLGAAIVSEELELGLRSVAVSVPGVGGGTRFAINISAQAQRVSETAMLDGFLPALHEAARSIAMAIQRR